MSLYLLRYSEALSLNENQVCTAIHCPDLERENLMWLSGHVFPESFKGPVRYNLPRKTKLLDYMIAVNITVLVSQHFGNIISDNSTCCRLYPAQVFFKNSLLYDNLYSVNFEKIFDIVDKEKSELDYVDLGDGTKFPYRYRRIFYIRDKLPENENVFIIPMCEDLVVTEAFRHIVMEEGITGCEFFDFEGELL